MSMPFKKIDDCVHVIPSKKLFNISFYYYHFVNKQDVFMKHKCPREWQIPLTAMPTSKLLKNRSNAKFTSSNHLFYYSSNINSHGKVLSQGTKSWYIWLKSYPQVNFQYVSRTSRLRSQGQIFLDSW
jgi:hypothetical protein